MTAIVCALPFLSRHDAVSNDSRMQVAALKAAGYDARLYAELFEAGCEAESIDFSEVTALLKDESAVLLVQVCVAWTQLDHMLQLARCKVVLRYHNITPPGFFDLYDPLGAFATRAGLAQMARIHKHPSVRMLMTCSAFTLQDVVTTWGAVHIPTAVIPTFTNLPEASLQGDDRSLKQFLADGRLHVFFIGRWAPNKGHHHLLGVISAYLELFGPNVCLTIAGNCSVNFRGYQAQIKQLAADLGLEQSLNLVGGVDDQQLLTYLQHSSLFLLMSEHEGFCVPIVEAQSFGLPVLALARTAVAETLGKGQLVLDEPDYDLFAAAAHSIGNDLALRSSLVAQGRVNAARFSNGATSLKLVTAIKCL